MPFLLGSIWGLVVNPNPEIYFYPMTFIDSALESPDQARSDGIFNFCAGISEINFQGQSKTIFSGQMGEASREGVR